MPRKILITGGTGYIGSHTAVQLISKGYEVIIIDNLVNSSDETIARIGEITGVTPTFCHLDLCNQSSLDHFFQHNKGIDAVIHFAALKAVKESVDQPVSYYRNNLVGLLNLVTSMVSHDVEHLVFSSSATVYGLPDQLPLTEDAQTKRPTSPYGNTKKVGEEILQDAVAVTEGLQAISLRYFNPIGAHPSGKLGELPSGIPNNLMPFITQTAVGKREKLMVYGDDYDTPDGTAVRDYIHVVDLAEAHIKAIERLMNSPINDSFEIYNLGTGVGSSVMEVIQSFDKATGEQLPYEIVERRSGDVPELYASTAKANELLGWKAERSLDEMTASSWKWESNLKKSKK